ncbi:DMT family transporter [Herbaspirillum robiniae]|uniref:Multidrug DMT transporter permease n=1 Tax=Herbaspirillum robiniae TaxID=2014887 RepID=A0A246WQ30_9BURK|nr:DMT family transporter [Herbaspirillum robiniae]OWY28460.1 multidrug DMT transporter permease [Herbaspirillum robiniae]
MSPSNIARLLLLAAIWGTSFMLMRIAAPVFGPMLTTFGRASLATVALLAYAQSRGVPLQWRRNWKPYLVIGLANTALPFSLFAWSALYIPSSYMATMNSLAPVFTAVFGFLLLGERLTPVRLGAFVLGLFGVAVLVGVGPVPAEAAVIFGVLAAMGAAVSYGFAATYTRMRGGGVAPIAMAAGSQFAAALCLIPFAAPGVPHALASGTWQALLAVLVLGVVCTGIAYALFFQLISSEGATKAITVTFLVPMTASLWAWLLLDEPVTAGTVAGIAIVLTATAIALRAKPAAPRATEKAPA